MTKEALAKQNEQANALLAKATELETRIADPAVEMTKEELETAAKGSANYRARAAAIATFTPTEEIERQGGDADLKRVAPESDDPETRTVRDTYEAWTKDAIKAFGHIDNYLRTVTNSAVYGAMGDRQKQVIKRGRALAKRIYGTDEMQQRTIVGTDSDASGGEFLLPLQQDPNIFQVANEQLGIMQYGARYPVTGRTLRIPYVVQTDGDNTRPMAGIAAITIVGEGVAKPVREPKFQQRLLTVYKWAAISKIGDETLGDDFTGDLAPTVTRLVGGQVMNEMNDYMTVIGDGTGEPLAALHANNGALLSLNRETTQSVSSNDVFKMWSRHTHGPNSYWSVSRRVVEKLFALTLGSNTLVTFLPDLRGRPALNLLGYPVRINDLQPTLGVKADLALINPAFYAVAVRTQLTVESSIHVEFVNDITTYRFFARGGGIPIPTATYAYKAVGGTKTDEHSPFVVLDDDATS